MKKLLLTFVVLSLACTCYSQTSKQNKIKQFLELTGAAKNSVQVMERMLDTYKEQMPDVPTTFWDKFKKGIDAAELVNMMVPIYDKHFEEKDIDGMIAFFTSPAGKKWTEKMPSINTEAMLAGQQWGKNLAEKIMTEMANEKKQQQ